MAFKAGAIYGEAKLNTSAWTSGMKRLTKSTKLAMAAIGVAIIGTMTKAIKVANEYQKALSNVSTLIDTSTISMQDLSKQLLKLSPELGNTTELTKGLYQAFSSGATSASDAMSTTVASAKFAVASLTDTFTAVDVLTTAMNAYGRETMSAEHASDVYFNTIKLGKITGEELASSIGKSIPLFATVGISLEELTSGMAAMTKQGINANIATTQLNAIVNSFIKPSEAMTQALEEQGYASGSALLKAEGLTGALNFLDKSAQGSVEALGELVPNVRGMKGVMALTGQGAEEFASILQQMGDVAGSTQEAFDKQEKTFTTLKNSMDKVLIVIGNIGKFLLDKIVVGLIVAGRAMLDFIMSSEGMNLVADVLGTISGTWEYLKNILSLVVDVVLPPLQVLWETLVGVFQEFNTETKEGIGATKFLVGTLKILATSFKISADFAALNINMLKNFVKILIDAGKAEANFAALLVGAAKWDDVKDSFKELGSSIRELGVEFVTDSATIIDSAIEGFGNFATDVTEQSEIIIASVKQQAQATSNYVVQHWDQMVTGQTDFLGSYMESLKEQVAVTQEANDQIQQDTEDTAEEIEVTWEDYYSNISKGMSYMLSGLKDMEKNHTDEKLRELELANQKEKEAIKSRLDSGEISKEEYDLKMNELDKRAADRENALKKKAFNDNKKFLIANVLMSGASAIMGWWAAAPQLGVIAGPIFAGIMTGLTGAMMIAQTIQIANQKYVPSRQKGGLSSGLTRINEAGGEMVVLPDRSVVIPNDISRQIAGEGSGPKNIIYVSFAGARINDDMDLNKIADKVSKKLGKELRSAV